MTFENCVTNLVIAILDVDSGSDEEIVVRAMKIASQIFTPSIGSSQNTLPETVTAFNNNFKTNQNVSSAIVTALDPKIFCSVYLKISSINMTCIGNKFIGRVSFSNAKYIIELQDISEQALIDSIQDTLWTINKRELTSDKKVFNKFKKERHK